jgi:CheY-like chemotaxis protein
MHKKRYILLAEDDPDDRDLFLEAVAIVDPAIYVVTVDNGEKLIEQLNEREPSLDCIFLDLNMPRKSGKECIKEIRKNEKTQRIPVIVYSTSMNARDVDDTFEFGASCFIRKPGTFRELTDVLNTHLTYLLVRSDHPRLKGNFVINPQKGYGK